MLDHHAIAYDLTVPPKIVFGWGRRAELPALAAGLGRRVLLVSGSRTLEERGEIPKLVDGLEQAGLLVLRVAEVRGEPNVEDVDRAAARARELGVSGERGPEDAFVLAVGGGSAIDLAKGVAALVAQPGEPSVREFLEGVGTRSLERPPLPVAAVPTTAGTGSEATRNAVISGTQPTADGERPFKKSLRDERLVPRIALVDPELSSFAPPRVTAESGMDAVTQLLESFISRRAQPLTQALALEGLRLAGSSLTAAYADGEHVQARANMAQAALLSGIALANSGLGLAHGVAAALGVEAGVPHGVACAVMLPVALWANREARLAELARAAEVFLGRNFERRTLAADSLIETVERLLGELELPRSLGALGVTPEMLPRLVIGSRGNSMRANPREVDDAELLSLLEARL